MSQNREILALNLILIIISSAFGIPSSALGAPKAVLTGPKESAAGKLVLISAKGSTGNKLVFQCFPENKDWQHVKLPASDTEGIIFSTNEPGPYVFQCIAVEDNNIDIATHNITITLTPSPGPGPDPKPKGPVFADSELKLMQESYNADVAAASVNEKPKCPGYRKTLSNIFRRADTIVDGVSYPNQIWDTLRNKSANELPASAIPRLRTTIAQIQEKYVSTFDPKLVPNTALTPDQRKAIKDLFQKVANSLDALNDPLSTKRVRSGQRQDNRTRNYHAYNRRTVRVDARSR